MVKLKYLFKVEYTNGEVFLQPEDDQSKIDPLRSAFFDIDQTRIKRFSLTDGVNNYAVDLRDGHFEINGVQFRLHQEEFKDLRLIFFRQHTHSFNAEFEEKAHVVAYRMGWQSLKDGHNFQFIIEFD